MCTASFYVLRFQNGNDLHHFSLQSVNKELLGCESELRGCSAISLAPYWYSTTLWLFLILREVRCKNRCFQQSILLLLNSISMWKQRSYLRFLNRPIVLNFACVLQQHNDKSVCSLQLCKLPVTCSLESSAELVYIVAAIIETFLRSAFQWSIPRVFVTGIMKDGWVVDKNGVFGSLPLCEASSKLQRKCLFFRRFSK